MPFGGVGVLWERSDKRRRMTPGVTFGVCLQLFAVFVACTNSAATADDGNNVQVTEHCEAETFQARCRAGEAVLMRHAKYGRMTVGRCVLRNYGYVGCSAPVLPHMDSLCSGRRECVVRIPDASLDQANPCPGDFKTYLEASYQCVKVTGSGCTRCKNGTVIRPRAPTGFLTSHPAGEGGEAPAGCDSARCPWVIQASPGQRLNVTLLDFTDAYGGDSQAAQVIGPQFGGFNTCYRYAVITEASVEGEVEVCGGNGRERSVYTSIGSSVTIQPINGLIRGKTPHYIFRYTVFGCADLEAPPHAWITREGESIEVGCRASSQKYHLQCNGNEWTGSLGECPPEAAAVGKTADEKGFKLPTGILISIIVGIALIIGALILTIGLVLIRRRKTADSYRKSNLSIRRVFTQEKAGPSGLCDTTSHCSYSTPYTPSSPKPCYESIINVSPSNFYHHTMDLRPLPSVPCVACTGRAQAVPHSHSFTNGVMTGSTHSEYTPIDIVHDAETARSTAYAAIDVVRGTERADRAAYDTINVMRRDDHHAVEEEEGEKGADAGSDASLLSPGDWKRHSRKSSSNSSTHSYCLPLSRDSGDYSDAPPYYTLDPRAAKASTSSDDSREYAVYQRDFPGTAAPPPPVRAGERDHVPVRSPVEVEEEEEEREPDELDTEIPASETQNELNECLSARNSLERRSVSPVENEYHTSA